MQWLLPLATRNVMSHHSHFVPVIDVNPPPHSLNAPRKLFRAQISRILMCYMDTFETHTSHTSEHRGDPTLPIFHHNGLFILIKVTWNSVTISRSPEDKVSLNGICEIQKPWHWHTISAVCISVCALFVISSLKATCSPKMSPPLCRPCQPPPHYSIMIIIWWSVSDAHLS